MVSHHETPSLPAGMQRRTLPQCHQMVDLPLLHSIRHGKARVSWPRGLPLAAAHSGLISASQVQHSNDEQLLLAEPNGGCSRGSADWHGPPGQQHVHLWSGGTPVVSATACCCWQALQNATCRPAARSSHSCHHSPLLLPPPRAPHAPCLHAANACAAAAPSP